jgi:hypothetical protein
MLKGINRRGKITGDVQKIEFETMGRDYSSAFCFFPFLSFFWKKLQSQSNSAGNFHEIGSNRDFVENHCR